MREPSLHPAVLKLARRYSARKAASTGLTPSQWGRLNCAVRKMAIDSWRAILMEYAVTTPFDKFLDVRLTKAIIALEPSERALSEAALAIPGPIAWKVPVVFPVGNDTVMLPSAPRAMERACYNMLSCGLKELSVDMNHLNNEKGFDELKYKIKDMHDIHVGTLQNFPMHAGDLPSSIRENNEAGFSFSDSIKWMNEAGESLGIPGKLAAYMNGIPVADLVG